MSVEQIEIKCLMIAKLLERYMITVLLFKIILLIRYFFICLRYLDIFNCRNFIIYTVLTTANMSLKMNIYWAKLFSVPFYYGYKLKSLIPCHIGHPPKEVWSPDSGL